MWRNREFLRECELLKEAGYECLFTPGTTVARGYADLGYEEFLLLGESTLLSLQSGKTSTLPDDHRRFFFAVPETEEVLEKVLRRGYEVTSLIFKEQRTWELDITHPHGARHHVSSEVLELVFIRALNEVLHA